MQKANRCVIIEALDTARRPGGYISKVRVRDRYHIVGFISSGTYGRVYKAIGKNGQKGEFAIKKYVTRKRMGKTFDVGRYLTRMVLLGSNPTRKASPSNIRAFHNLPYEKCPFAPSCRMQMLSNWRKSFWKINVSSWSLNTRSTICSK